MKRREFVAVAAATLAVFGTTQRANAQVQAVPEAAAFIAGLSQRAISGLTDAAVSAADRAKRFGELLREAFDVPAIGQFVLGRHWRAATEDQRTEYLGLFEEFLIQNYAKRFGEYSGENLRVDQTRAGQDNDVVITSSLVRKQGAPIRIVWRVRRDGESFRIFDVTVEGVSLVVTHRDDFGAVIQAGGGRVEALLTSLRTKVKQGPAA